MIEEIKVLEDHPHLLSVNVDVFPGMGNFFSMEPYPSTVGKGKLVDTAEESAFTGSAWADKNLGFALLDFEGNPFQKLQYLRRTYVYLQL